jgi:hypothetical protein
MLREESDRQVFADEYDMKSANDTLYSMFGLFSQMEKLADSYVVLGELRADLVDVTDVSNTYLKEVNSFNMSSQNPYAPGTKLYYSIINNCNYILHKMDTSTVKGGEKVMYRDYAACKSIRAWTYMQLVLNYGSAIYYEKPILSVKEAEEVQKQTPLTMTELAPLLIADIKPYENVENPNFGSLYTFNTKYAFFPVRFVLGDLYLWAGQYENAANAYHDLIDKYSYRIDNANRNNWVVTNHAFTGTLGIVWDFVASSFDDITSIGATNEFKPVFTLDSLVYNRSIIPSELSIINWDKQRYFQEYYNGRVVDTLMDTRKFSYVNSSVSMTKITTTSKNYISNYISLNPLTGTTKTSKRIKIYTVPLLYLRYAEAVNRLGKPNLAFAVLKYGMTNTNILSRVPLSERTSTMPNYMNFSNSKFDYYSTVNNVTTHYFNVGVRMRGCGNVNQDTTYYKIPKALNLEDSIVNVENLIEQELSLETAFGGNRFHDLMRLAIRRNDNAYLADKIAAKHKDNAEAIRKTLMERSNWYLKK